MGYKLFIDFLLLVLFWSSREIPCKTWISCFDLMMTVQSMFVHFFRHSHKKTFRFNKENNCSFNTHLLTFHTSIYYSIISMRLIHIIMTREVTQSMSNTIRSYPTCEQFHKYCHPRTKHKDYIAIYFNSFLLYFNVLFLLINSWFNIHWLCFLCFSSTAQTTPN